MVDSNNVRSGIFVKLPSTEVIDIARYAGFDLVVVDLEHAQLHESAASRLIRHAVAVGITPFVRIPVVDSGQVNRLLEAGAAGIQLSAVRARSQIDKLVECCHYAPRGRRSISLTQSCAQYGAITLEEYLEASAAGPILVAQIETMSTDDPLDEILAADVDVAFVGAVDLAVDSGLDHEAVERRVDEIAEAALRVGASLGGYRLDHADCVYRIDHSDIGLLVDGAQRSRPVQASGARIGEMP